MSSSQKNENVVYNSSGEYESDVAEDLGLNKSLHRKLSRFFSKDRSESGSKIESLELLKGDKKSSRNRGESSSRGNHYVTRYENKNSSEQATRDRRIEARGEDKASSSFAAKEPRGRRYRGSRDSSEEFISSPVKDRKESIESYEKDQLLEETRKYMNNLVNKTYYYHLLQHYIYIYFFYFF